MATISSRIQRLHLPAMVGSFVLAVLLWLYVQLQQHYGYRMQIPIVISNLKEGKVLKQPLPPSMMVQVNGPGTALMALRLFLSSQVKFHLNLETINEYWKCPTNNYVNWVSLPPGLEQLRIQRIITPDTIIVMLDALDDVRVPVRSDSIKIVAKSGFVQIGPVVFKPDSVNISGPQSSLKDIKALFTVAQSFADRDHDFTFKAPLARLSPQIQCPTEEISGSSVIQRIGERIIKNIPVTITNAPQGLGFRIEPEDVNITIHGGEQLIQRLSVQDIVPFIPYQQQWRRKKTYRLPVQVSIPKNVLYYEVFPTVLTVNIE